MADINIIRQMLKIGGTVYNEQPRWFDYDYHPQQITAIHENEIETFEPGYFPNGKAFSVKIESLRLIEGVHLVY